ncbi:hypothetical protein PRIPAC_79721 [Pristionchus pacificus]|uniref:Uncharacterized protein n=1 Tax=Pristionchus pacificus TaxID=54126 RepID=A0A2A6BVL7_PRIPA|nr:hypothetical protein PRIPAC_79721 [Pristionchus pacificus]|eukprot:PDM69949.1 hypothetical protein PRIPAC_49161 [Pristionchus pacificus]
MDPNFKKEISLTSSTAEIGMSEAAKRQTTERESGRWEEGGETAPILLSSSRRATSAAISASILSTSASRVAASAITQTRTAKRCVWQQSTRGKEKRKWRKNSREDLVADPEQEGAGGGRRMVFCHLKRDLSRHHTTDQPDEI